MYRKAEIIEEVDEGGICDRVYIISAISPYDDLIIFYPKRFHVALGIEIKIPIITHDLTDIIEHFIDISRNLFHDTGIMESSCLVDLLTRRKKNLPQCIGIVTCEEIEAVQAVIIKPCKYRPEHLTSAVDRTYQLVGELLIVQKAVTELRYVSENLVKAQDSLHILGDISP